MVTRAGLSETDLIFNLCEGCPIEVSGHLDLEAIEWMSSETKGAPSRFTGLKLSSAQSKIRADNAGLESHST